MKIAHVLAFVVLLVSSSLAEEIPDIKLMASGDMLQPGSTLEFRFTKEMVGPDRLGAAKSPIVFKPAWAGTFTWLSTRSGVFVPSEPPPLGTKFALRAQPGLKALDGKPVGGRFRAEISTPPFQITRTENLLVIGDEVRSGGSLVLFFNQRISLDQAAKHFRFRNSAGLAVPATVSYWTTESYIGGSKPGEEDWEQRWNEAIHPSSLRAGGTSDKPIEIQSRLTISPANPLPVGDGWKLEMSPGLRALNGKNVLKAPYELDLGNVSPLKLVSLKPGHYINSGCTLALEFSNELAPDITSETAGQYFTITPAVGHLRFEQEWRNCSASGDFEVGKDYELHIGDGVLSSDGVPFAGSRTVTFRFGPVPPRLYLPEITGHQIRGGRRLFDVQSVNLQTLKVGACLVAPENAVRAVAAFEQYTRTDSNPDEPDEKFQPLPPDAITGHQLPGETVQISDPARDSKAMTSLDWTKILGNKKSGIIFLTVSGELLDGLSGKRPAAQALIQLTDLGILWKTPDKRLLVTVFSMAQGKPVEGADVSLFDESFQQIATGTSDARGEAALARGEKPSWLLVKKGDDAHVLRLGESGGELPMATFNVPIYYHGWEAPHDDQRSVRSMIFTDRPVYRPSESVRVKGIVRKAGGATPEPVDGLHGEIEVWNRGESIATIPVTSDRRGAFDSQWEVPAGVFGTTDFRLKLDNTEPSWWEVPASCTFEIADYQPNAFEVKVAAPSRFAPAQPVVADVSAGYLFGAPLTKADVRWTLQYGGTGFSPEGFDHFSFRDEFRSDRSTLRGEGLLADKKPFLIEPKLPGLESGPVRGTLTVEVTDLNQQTVSHEHSFVRDSSDFYLGIERDENYFVQAGTNVLVNVVAVSPDGKPLEQPVEISAVLTRDRNDVVRLKGAGGSTIFRTSTAEEKIAEANGKSLIPNLEGSAWVVRNVGGGLSFSPKTPGAYKIRVTAKDSGGRLVTCVREFSVAGPGQFVWNYRNASQVDMLPDKMEYRAGDVAKILIKAPIEGDALVTVERGTKILRSFQTRLEGSAPTIEVPVSADDTPDVYVSMVLIRGADESKRKFKMPDYKYGLCMLRIADPRADVKVEIAPQKREVQPGQEVVAEITVRDGLGAPVADAEVTFFAVDDGILNLTGYSRPAPAKIFNAPVPLQIRTGLSLFELMPEDPSDLQFGNKGYLIGGGGLDGPGLTLRENFPGTACWLPSLHADAEGRVVARFAAPDALTRYRLVAVAHSGGMLFGSGESSISIVKPLMVLPSTGQFANAGDSLIARAVIRNQSLSDGAVDVALETGKNVEMPDGHSAHIEVPAGQSRTVDFPVRFLAPGKAEWTWSASMKSGDETLRDSVRTVFPVGSPMLMLRETYLQDASQPTNNLFANINPQLSEGTGHVAITLANTRLASLRESLTYLREYPYGCAEQTTSGLIPWIVLPALRPVLTGFSPDEKEIHRVLEASVARLFSMQTDSGGLSFWPGKHDPSVFASAWAAVALTKVKSAGFPLPPGYSRLLEFLGSSLLAEKPPQLSDQALIVYALSLAEKPDASRHALLFEKRSQLPRESRALLALAVLHAKGPTAMIKSLLDPNQVAPEDVSPFGGASRDGAIQLLAWTSVDPKSNETARLVKELLAFRKNGRWGSTQDNAWALMAIENYFKTTEAGGQGLRLLDGTLACGSESAPFQLSAEKRSVTRSFPIAPSNAPASAEVANPSKGSLFAETTFAVYPPLGQQPRQDRGFSVSRSYHKIESDGSSGPTNDLKVGDRVLVTLRVESSLPANFVAIDDPLPSILEAVNPEFKSRKSGEMDDSAAPGPCDYREIRADRVLYFCDRLPAGAFVFQYLARVRSAGTAAAPSTKAEEMYRPDRFGLGALENISSKPATGQ